MNESHKQYHHGNLRTSLIEKGIELVSEYGVRSFSLRKLAFACNVSHAAPYNHFKNKEELLHSMQLHITEQFYDSLQRSVEGCKESYDILEKAGIAYSSFFIEHPAYFDFLYSRSDIRIDLSLLAKDEENYKPYVFYKNAVLLFLEEVNCPKQRRNDILITLWSFIHGLTSLATMKHVQYDENWEKKIVDFMKVFRLSFL